MKKIIAPAILVGLLVLMCFSMNFSKAKTVKRPMTEAPKGFDEAYVKRLEALGFSQNESVLYLQSKKHQEYWSQTFGLNFIGDGEIQKFLMDNDFIMGEASKYVGDIPKEAGDLISSNLTLLKNKYAPFVKYEMERKKEIDRGWVSGGVLTLSFNIPEYPQRQDLPNGTTMVTNMENGKLTTTYDTIPERPNEIWIIAAKAKFNTEGMQLEGRILRNPPEDPIALVKVKNGYVEIANW